MTDSKLCVRNCAGGMTSEAAVNRLKKQVSSSCLLQFEVPVSSSKSYLLSFSIPDTSYLLSTLTFLSLQRSCDPKYYDDTLDLYSW